MTKSVWVIEEGEYSDYRVVGVYSSQDKAETVSARIGGAVAQWPLDPGVEEIRAGMNQFLVRMERDGSIDTCEQREPSGYRVGGDAWLWHRSTHAVKVANEKRVQMIASGEWQ